MHTKVGQITFKAPEFIVAEILQGISPEEMKPIGYGIFGPGFTDSETFQTSEAAVTEARRLLLIRHFKSTA